MMQSRLQAATITRVPVGAEFQGSRDRQARRSAAARPGVAGRRGDARRDRPGQPALAPQPPLAADPAPPGAEGRPAGERRRHCARRQAAGCPGRHGSPRGADHHPEAARNAANARWGNRPQLSLIAGEDPAAAATHAATHAEHAQRMRSRCAARCAGACAAPCAAAARPAGAPGPAPPAPIPPDWQPAERDRHEACRARRAILVIAKLDRLARNTAAWMILGATRAPRARGYRTQRRRGSGCPDGTGAFLAVRK